MRPFQSAVTFFIGTRNILPHLYAACTFYVAEFRTHMAQGLRPHYSVNHKPFDRQVPASQRPCHFAYFAPELQHLCKLWENFLTATLNNYLRLNCLLIAHQLLQQFLAVNFASIVASSPQLICLLQYFFKMYFVPLYPTAS